jgi:hypothetical protein
MRVATGARVLQDEVIVAGMLMNDEVRKRLCSAECCGCTAVLPLLLLLLSRCCHTFRIRFDGDELPLLWWLCVFDASGM